METSRLSTKGQATIPRRIRQAAHLQEGDLLAFSVDRFDRVIIERVHPLRGDSDELRAIEATLTEWNGPEDEDAWRNL